MVPSDSRVFRLSLFFDCDQHRHQSTRSLALTGARPPLLRNTEGKQEEQCQKAFIPDSLSDAARAVCCSLSLSYAVVSLGAGRVSWACPSHAYISGPTRRSRFYCCRKLMRSRGDTTDMTERKLIRLLQHIRFHQAISFRDVNRDQRVHVTLKNRLTVWEIMCKFCTIYIVN